MQIHQVFSKKQTILCLSIREVNKRISQRKIKLREVNQPHVRAIKRYIFDSAESGQVYFPPIVGNVDKGYFPDWKDGEISIIDGSHCLMAFFQLEEMMQKAINSEEEEEIRKGYFLLNLFEQTMIAIQLFEGFSQAERNQLYIDLNTKGKKVSLSKRISYDSRNHINQITNHVLSLNKDLQKAGVEMEKTAIIRPGNKKLVSLTQLRQLIGVFVIGKVTHSTAEFMTRAPLKSEEYIHLINVWFQELFRFCSPVSIGDYHESMLAGYPLLLSVAIYANQGLITAPFHKREDELLKRMTALATIDFHRDNVVWEQFDGSHKGKYHYFYLSNTKSNIAQIVKWLEQQGR